MVNIISLINIVSNSNQIVIYTKNYNQDSLKNAEFFYNYIYDNYLYYKKFYKNIIYKQGDRDYDDFDKYVVLFWGINSSIRQIETADLVILIDGTEITIIKTRYYSHDNTVYDLKDITMFQRKNKLIKILKKIISM